MLSKRLYHIAQMFNESDNVADIGADHGKLVLYLANKYQNSSFLAVENKKGPFSILEKAVNENSLFKNIECSLSDGIEYVPQFVNTLVFAGMGGMNVINIIEKSYKNLKNIKKIVICVNNKINEVVNFLYRIGFDLESFDAIKEDGKIYLIFSFILDQAKRTIDFSNSILIIKRVLIENNLYNEYVEKLKINNEKEQKSKKNLGFYEYSESFNLNHLLISEEK